MRTERLLLKIEREHLPLMKNRYPFLYLERGRLEIDDSSIQWLGADGHIFPIPVATIGALLIGPGTSITHEAIKVASSANCTVCWVGEDSLLFYAVGLSPTANTRNFKKQIELVSNPVKSLKVAQKMFSKRFPGVAVEQKSLAELKGMEGHRVKMLYQETAEKHGLNWLGRKYVPGDFNASDLSNKILTASNNFLYALTASIVYSLGFSPHIGFIHSGSPLPLVYDLADLYKDFFTIDFSFSITKELLGIYDRDKVIDAFRKRVSDHRLLERMCDDLIELMEIRK